MMCVNNKLHYYPMVVFLCLHITLPHYHHYADLSESIELIKCLSGTFCLECVPKIKSMISIIFHAIYRVVHIQLTHFSYDDCGNMCTCYSFIIIIKSEVWPICHCFGLDHEQWYALYSISQEICTRFLLCCALLWLYIDWFSHIHQAYFTGTVAI